MNTKFDCDIVNGLSNAVCGRIDLLEKMLGVKVRENLRYSDIQKIVKSGFAEEFFDLGDEIMTTYTATDGTEYDFPWLVVDFRDVYWENDPDPHPGMVLQAKYATAEKVIFDAPENTIVDSETEQTAQEGWYYFGVSNNGYYTKLNLNPGDTIPFSSYTSIRKNIFSNSQIASEGYNDYKMSSVRQWLNSDADVGEWWSPAHDGDVAPTELYSINGFLAGLPEDFRNIIIPTMVKYIRSDVIQIVYDKMFVPSIKEMYGKINIDINDVEGPYFKYWKEATGFDSPNNNDSSARDVRSVNNQSDALVCWTRTGYDDIMIIVLIMVGGSFLGTVTTKFNLSHVLPCCVIS